MEVPRTQQLEQIIRLYGRTHREGGDELKTVEAAVQADIARCRAQLPSEAFEPQMEPLFDATARAGLVRDASFAVLNSLGRPTHKTWRVEGGGASVSGATVNFDDVPPEAREVINRFAVELGGLSKPAKVFPEKRHPLSRELTPAVLTYFEGINGRYGRVPLDSRISNQILQRFELISTVLNDRQVLESFELAVSDTALHMFHTTSGLDRLRIQRGIVMVERGTAILGNRYVHVLAEPGLVEFENGTYR